MSRRVLIAEDDAGIVASLEFIMGRCGFEVLVAGDGQAALDAYAAFRPDLVVLDLMLPRVSGLDVCRRIREVDGTTPKILMLTARGSQADRDRGFEAGADDYVVKPFATQDLMRRAREMLP